MNDNLTPEEYAEVLKEAKPYLAALEAMVDDMQYGQVEVIMTVRAGVIEDIKAIERKTVYIRQKKQA